MHKTIFYIWYKLPKYFLFPFLPLSILYLIVISIRKYILINIVTRFKSNSKVIIVGNINVGGSGKTPFTIWLANYLQFKGKKIAIVSSGFGSSVSLPEVVHDKSKPDLVGDEAVLLYEKTLTTVVSSNNRVRSTRILDNDGYDFIIHDDGLQHYRLYRNHEFMLTKMDNDYSNDYLLPCGPLREPKSFHQNSENILSNYKGNDLPGFFTNLTEVRSGISNNVYKLTDKKFSNAILITAIANNTPLINQLKSYNIKLKVMTYPDHYYFKKNDFPNSGKPILVTEKDFVKIKKFNLDNIYILEQKLYPNDKLLELIHEYLI